MFGMHVLVDHCCVTGMCRSRVEVSILKAILLEMALFRDQRSAGLYPLKAPEKRLGNDGNKTLKWIISASVMRIYLDRRF